MSSHFAKSSAYVAITGLSNSVTTFVSTLIVARALGVEGTGIVSFAVWLASTMVVAADFGIAISLARFMPELRARGQELEAANLAGWLLRPLLITSITFPVAALFAAGHLRNEASLATFAGAEYSVWLLTAILCIFQSLANFSSGYLQGLQDFRKAAFISSASLIIQLSAVTAGCLILGIPGALIGYLCGSIIPATIVVRAARFKPTISPELRRRVLRYAKYSWANSLIGAIVYSRLELFFLDQFSGTKAVAMFSVALSLSSLATQGPVLLSRGTFFYFVDQFGKGDFERVRSMFEIGTRLVALLVLPACLVMAATMPLVLPMIYGSVFNDSVPVAAILVSSSAVVATLTVTSNLLMALERNDFLFYCGLIGAALSILFGLTLIPHFGAIGAATGRAVVQIVMIIPGILLIARRLKFSLPLASLGKLLFAAILAAASAYECIEVVHGIHGLILGLFTASVVYLVLVRLTKAIPMSDALMLQSRLAGFPNVIKKIPVAILRSIAS